MSNYLSQDIQYNQPPTDANFELLSKVALMQQQKYDVNHQQIQATLDQFGAMKVLRGEDNAYIAAKLNSITTQINASGGNLANQSLSDSLMGKIKGAAQDPFILNAFEQTAKMKTYQAEVAKLKEKKPELYNDLNNAYALEQAGYDDYMSGKTDKLGTLSYTPYTDYSKEFKEISENLDKYANVVKTSKPGGDGYIYSSEGKYLDKEEIESMVGTLLSNGAKKQMQINGWASYDKGSTEEEKLKNVTTEFTTFSKNSLENIDSKIRIAELNLQKTPDDEKLQKNLEDLKTHKEQMSDSYSTMISKGNKSGMYTEMYTKQTIGAFASSFAFNNISPTVAEDGAYWKKADLAYKIEKDRTTATKEEAQSVQTRTDEAYAPPEEKANLYEQQTTRVDALEKEAENAVNNVYNKLDAKTKVGVDEKVKATGLTRAEILLDSGIGSSKIISAKDRETITMAQHAAAIEKNRLVKYTEQATKEATATLDDNNGALAKRLFNNPDIKIMWKDAKGNERMYSARDVLLKAGIVDNKGNVLKKIGNFKDLSTSLQKSILADKFISNYSGYQKSGVSEESSLGHLRALSSLFGESEEKAIIKGQGVGGAYYKVNPNSRTGQYILNQQKQGGYNQGGALGVFMKDNSFDDIPEVDNYLKKVENSAIRTKVGELLYNDTNSVMGIGRVTTVDPSSVTGKDIANITGNIVPGSGYSIEIRPIPNQPNMVRISQNVAPTAKIPNPAPITKDLKIEDLPASLQSKINLQNTKSVFTTETIPTTETHVVYNNSNDKIHLFDVGNTYFPKDSVEVQQQKAKLTTVEGATASLYQSYPEKLGTVDKPTELGLLVNKMLNDKNLFVTVDKQRLSSGVIAVPKVLRKEGDKITTIFTGDPYTGRITDDNAEAAFRTIKFTPQIYVNTAIKNIIGGFDTGDAISIEKLKELYANK